jgi:hypothetical protein
MLWRQVGTQMSMSVYYTWLRGLHLNFNTSMSLKSQFLKLHALKMAEELSIMHTHRLIFSSPATITKDCHHSVNLTVTTRLNSINQEVGTPVVANSCKHSMLEKTYMQSNTNLPRKTQILYVCRPVQASSMRVR